MRRRSGLEEDALELLLDTICNVFGGMILMAILVVVQTRVGVGAVASRSGEAAPEPAGAPADAERLRELEREAERLRATYAATASPEAAAIVARRERFRAALAETERALELAAADVDALKGERAGEAPSRRAEQERLARLRERLERERAALGAAPAPSERVVRLPVRHETSAPLQIHLLVEGPRVFLLQDCTAARVSLSPPVTAVRPQPGKGLVVPAELGRLSLPEAPGRAFVSLWVARSSASFAAFQEVRSAVVRLGYEYSLGSYDAAEGLLLAPGRPKVE